MTALRLIGIAPSGTAMATGLAGMTTIDCGPIVACAVESCEVITLDAVKMHHRMVIACLGSGAFLPAVVGVDHESEAHLLADLMPRAETLLAQVLQFQGRAEWSLRCQPQVIDCDAPMSGRAYLRGRQAAARQLASTRAMAADVCARLTAAGRVEDAVVGRGGNDSLSFNLLLRRATADATLDDVARTLSGLLPATTMRRSGPWPAYSFSPLRLTAQGMLQ